MLEEIIIQNPWWKTKQISEIRLGKIERKEFQSLKKELDEKKVTCLLGPRRSGKTTLMYEMMNYLLETKINPENILYLSFDNSKIRVELEDFNKLIQEYANIIVKQPIGKLTSKIFIFLDEIHKLENWGDKVKYWEDMNLKIKFIISGSSSARILKGSGESLLGRINFHTILPLLFSEFSGKIQSADITSFHEIEKIYKSMILDKQDLIIKLEDYILKGGFPEVYPIADINIAYDILRQYKTLTINRDILDLKDIKEPRILSDLTDTLSDFMSQRINYSTFASILKTKVDTIKKYLSYLEESFMIYNSYFYSKRQLIATRKEKKLYFIDAGLRNSLLLKEVNDDEKAKIVENLVFMHLFYLKRNELFPKIFYWTDDNKNEVDFIFSLNKNLIPIEVKYRNQIQENDLKGLLNFMKKFKTKIGIVVTKDIFKKEGKIIYIPVWLFLSII